MTISDAGLTLSNWREEKESAKLTSFLSYLERTHHHWKVVICSLIAKFTDMLTDTEVVKHHFEDTTLEDFIRSAYNTFPTKRWLWISAMRCTKGPSTIAAVRFKFSVQLLPLLVQLLLQLKLVGLLIFGSLLNELFYNNVLGTPIWDNHTTQSLSAMEKWSTKTGRIVVRFWLLVLRCCRATAGVSTIPDSYTRIILHFYIIPEVGQPVDWMFNTLLAIEPILESIFARNNTLSIFALQNSCRSGAHKGGDRWLAAIGIFSPAKSGHNSQPHCS